MKEPKTHKLFLYFLILLISAGILNGCAKGQNSGYSSGYSSTKVNTKVTSEELEYDSKFTGVLQGIDRKLQECTFFDINTGMLKQLSYTGATRVKNRYEKEQSFVYLEPGRIFDVYYEEGEKKLVKAQENKEAFEYRKIGEIRFDNTKHMINMVDKKFSFDDSMKIFCGDNEINQIELNRQDELTVRGMGRVVYSIQVTAGHGYVSFVNYEDFIGGYVSLGDRQVFSVTPDMLLVAREGTYEMSMENGELSGRKRITVEKDQRIVVDMGEFRTTPERVGNIKFVISPKNASLYVNDKWQDSSRNLKLNFGTHKVKVVMDGYQDFNGVLTVSGNQQQTIEISLAKRENDKADIRDDGDSELVERPGNNGNRDDNGSGNGGNRGDSGNGDSNRGDNDSDGEDGNSGGNDGSEDDGNGSDEVREDRNHTITVKGPEGASVYLDGALIGTAPVSTEKITGHHTITLYKSGYITKSYEIEVEDDNKDITLEFPALLTGFE